jgi:hypothetical protein
MVVPNKDTRLPLDLADTTVSESSLCMKTVPLAVIGISAL